MSIDRGTVPAVALTIQQVSTLTGLSLPTLRYYEEIGLIEPVPREESSGHRRYPPHTLERIESLAHLRAAGLSIEAMRTLMASGGHSPETIATKVDLLAAHRDRVEAEITGLVARRDYLQNRIAYWRARQGGDQTAAELLEREADSLVDRLT